MFVYNLKKFLHILKILGETIILFPNNNYIKNISNIFLKYIKLFVQYFKIMCLLHGNKQNTDSSQISVK